MAKEVEFVWEGEKAAGDLLSAAFAGLVESAAHIFAQSQALVPREDGQLAESGQLLPDPANLEVVISYGNNETQPGYTSPANDYAVVQHEDTTLEHPNGGQAKYLEEPLMQEAGEVGATVAKHMRERLR